MKLLLTLFLLFPILLYAQKPGQQVETHINFGAKAGFTSAMMLIDKLNVDGEEVREVQNSYKIGYFGSLFMRINFDRHFLQPELSYTVQRSTISFDQSTINSSIHSFELPIMYGYNIIKEGPYSMAVLGGPTLRYIWKKKSRTEFENFSTADLHEQLYPLNASFTLGVAITISRVFFDFRYDIGLHNITKRVSTSEELSPIKLRRRENALSFSLGIFF